MLLLPAASRTAPASVSSLTSGRTRRLMRPSPRTVGTKARPTPYCLNWIVTTPSRSATGIGNSPPARKDAVSPLFAVRLGSARMFTRRFCASRSRTPFTSKLPPRQFSAAAAA